MSIAFFAALAGFLRAQLILIGSVGLVLFLGLLIVDVPYVLTIALLAAPCTILPLFETGIILFPPGIAWAMVLRKQSVCW